MRRAALIALLVLTAGCADLSAYLIDHGWPSPAPTPAPVPVPPPDPAPPPGADEIPLASCDFYGGDPRGYPITARMLSVAVAGGRRGPVTVTTEWEPAPWPVLSNGVVGNDWICAPASDRWACGVWEMVRADRRAVRTSEARAGQPPFVQAHGPPATWIPRRGDVYGYLRTTVTRGTDAAAEPVHERAQMLRGVWP